MLKKKPSEIVEMQQVGTRVIIVFVVIVVAYFAVMAMNSYWNLPDDNEVEELIEAVIQGTTGADLDLTPDLTPSEGT